MTTVAIGQVPPAGFTPARTSTSIAAPVRRVFPGTASRPDYQTRPSQRTGLPSSFVLSAAIVYSLLCVRDDALVSTSVRAGRAALPQGPSLRSGLFCPGPSSLIRPHPPHSRAHLDFTVLRLIPDAFAVHIRICLAVRG